MEKSMGEEIEARLYAIGDVGENSPLMFTTNYFLVKKTNAQTF